MRYVDINSQKEIHEALDNVTIGNYTQAHKILTKMVNDNYKYSIKENKDNTKGGSWSGNKKVIDELSNGFDGV